MTEKNKPGQEEWTLEMTFRWLEEAADFLIRMGVLKPCSQTDDETEKPNQSAAATQKR